ncbi:MAG: lysine--tRNA ligase [Planctomycetia bacterium]|nr:lysine--tRNA ligase [Planctomycetia bacterium]
MAKAENAVAGAALEAARREKLRKIIELGHDPWGARFDNRSYIGDVRSRENEIVLGEPIKLPPKYPGAPERTEIPSNGPQVRVAGRIVLQRKQGKLIFLTIKDWTGEIQIFIGKNQVGEQAWELALCFDLGDLVGVDGEFKKTQTGELTVFAEKLTFLSKSLETPPDKFKGVNDPELRSRMRYVDLAHNDEAMTRMLNRTKIVSSIRQTLAGEGFVEVEGPTLHSVAGGAAAKPFITHHNALDIDLYMRIALELHLKRLMVGGMERVFEIGRVYRNEGIDQTHNPEFTLMEVYQAYGDYNSMMDLTEKIICNAIKATGQGFVLPWGGQDIDFTPPFQRKPYFEALAEYAGIDPYNEKEVVEYAKSIQIEDVDKKHIDVLRNDIFEEKVEDSLTGPVFITDYPASICPLTKRKRNNPEIAERFELFVRGCELANAYTELNDPDLQDKLFRSQLEGQKDEDSMAKMDHDFIRALRYAMPPAGGLGIGIDRLAMMLTNTTSIREVILFPLLKPEVFED